MSEKARLIGENAAALATLRRALDQPYLNRPVRRMDQTTPELARFRALARLLTIEGQVREAGGDYASATQSGIDAIALGVAVPRGGGVIDSLVGDACDAIGQRRLWHRIDHLNAGEATAAAWRLEALNDHFVPYADVLREEKWTGESCLVNELRDKTTIQAWNSMRDLMSGDSDDNQISLGERLHAYIGLTRYSKQQIVDGYATAMDAGITAAALPYSRSAPEIATPPDPMNQFFFGVFAQGRFKHETARMNTGLLSCACALRAYHLRHGAYPTSLSALVDDGMLNRLPADPFAGAGNVPFRYRSLPGDKFLLYSVGPDGVDDAGRPINLDDRKPVPRTTLNSTDNGDWVVGIDTPKD